jgi:uncharacterized protein (TIGR04255 family)
MAKAKRYPAAPIFDAVIELRFKKPLSAIEIASVVRALKPGYEKHEQTGEVEVMVRIEGERVEPSISDPRPVHIFSNADQNDFCRLERGKLHWSRMPPYDCWETLQARMTRDLTKLPKKLGFRPLERVGVRFQNRIDVPLEVGPVTYYEKYLSVNISLPALLDPHNSYMWTVVKSFEEKQLGARVASGIVEPVLPNTMAVSLDIDVFALVDLPSTIDDLFSLLAKMRTLKNDIFEACITDEARASFR